MSSYVYIRSEPGLWTVGFYTPDGSWEPESDHAGSEGAARRAALLNGAPSDYHLLVDELKELRAEVAKLREQSTEPRQCECCYAEGHTTRCGRLAELSEVVHPFGELPLSVECRDRVNR